jgi:uncharacterized protein (TIGR02246 family)
MKKAAPVIALIVMLFGIAESHAQEDAQALADRWAKAYNAHDQAALESVYTEDAVLYLHGSPMIKGKEKIGNFWAEDFKKENPITNLQVTNFVEGVDMILVHGNYQVVDEEAGVTLGHGRFAHIWHEENGSWKLDRDLWNQPY